MTQRGDRRRQRGARRERRTVDRRQQHQRQARLILEGALESDYVGIALNQPHDVEHRAPGRLQAGRRFHHRFVERPANGCLSAVCQCGFDVGARVNVAHPTRGRTVVRLAAF